MIYNAKLSRFRIAFHAKPTVKLPSSISSLGLDGVLYLLVPRSPYRFDGRISINRVIFLLNKPVNPANNYYLICRFY
jgi:hypothetical protein